MLHVEVAPKEEIYEISKHDKLISGSKFSGNYSHDLNILEIHLTFRDVFSFHVNNRDKTLARILQYKKNLEKTSLKYLDRKEILKAKLEDEEICRKFSIEEWNKYRELVKPILSEYAKVTTYKKTKPIKIGSKKRTEERTENITEDNLRLRLSLIKKFIQLLSRFIETEFIFHPPFQIGCEVCGLCIDQMNTDEDLGVYICDCNCIFGNIYSNETPHIDPDRVEGGSKNSYDDKTNFIRCLKSYQGFQTKKISKEMIDQLDKHMQDKYQHPPAEITRTLPPDKYGHRGNFTSVSLLKEALRETQNTSHFQDIRPICYELWGWVVPNIDHLVLKILDDYNRTQEVYKRLNIDASSINVELRLYWHLRIAGHECLLEDFKIPHSRDSKKRYSHIMKIMCEETKLEFFPII